MQFVFISCCENKLFFALRRAIPKGRARLWAAFFFFFFFHLVISFEKWPFPRHNWKTSCLRSHVSKGCLVWIWSWGLGAFFWGLVICMMSVEEGLILDLACDQLSNKIHHKVSAWSNNIGRWMSTRHQKLITLYLDFVSGCCMKVSIWGRFSDESQVLSV